MKPSLSTSQRHTWGGDVQFHSFLTTTLLGRALANFTHRSLYPRLNSSGIHWTRGWASPPGTVYTASEDEQIILPLSGMERPVTVAHKTSSNRINATFFESKLFNFCNPLFPRNVSRNRSTVTLCTICIFVSNYWWRNVTWTLPQKLSRNHKHSSVSPWSTVR